MVRERRNSFTLVELLIVLGILAVIVTVILVSLNPGKAGKEARDLKRKKDLQVVQAALLMNENEGGNPVTGIYFSPWDRANNHTVNYWSGGNPPWSTAFYDALVGKDYLKTLPMDPINIEDVGDGKSYLGGITDRGYVYWSDGSCYILGTNLESGDITPADYRGNYQIKWGNCP